LSSGKKSCNFSSSSYFPKRCACGNFCPHPAVSAVIENTTFSPNRGKMPLPLLIQDAGVASSREWTRSTILKFRFLTTFPAEIQTGSKR
jgi:hypothetical protein